MIKREVFNDLEQWKTNSKKKPILVRGARQVGKSFIIREFGNREFEHFIEINFERSPEFKAIFDSLNPKEIIEKIELLKGITIVPGKTLLFFDEIQECVQAILSLRYFYEEMPQLHVIGAGSLLEFALKSADIKIPVGRISYLYMYPLSFCEFVAAVENEKLSDYIRNFTHIRNMDELIHKKLLELVRKYLLIGGMPEVVQSYIDEQNFETVSQLQSSLIETYIDDFGRYAKQSQFKHLQSVFYGASKLLGEKFVFSQIDPNLKTYEVKNSLELLETAGLLHKIYNSKPDGLPLEAGINLRYFKVIMLDVGLFSHLSGVHNQLIQEKDLSGLFRGAIAEQFTGQELIVNQNPSKKAKLFYWARAAKSSNAEVDYLIQKNSQIIPIEVKAGSTGMMRSLKVLMEKHQLDGYRVSKLKYEKNRGITSIPFYGISAFMKS